MTDYIFIQDLRLRGKIGVADWEKKARQDLIINIRIGHDQRPAAETDDVEKTVDYRVIRDRIVEHVEGIPHELIETLAEHLATMVLEDEKVQEVRVRVDKPGALRFEHSVAVEIERSR